MINLDELRKKAEAATKYDGPTFIDDDKAYSDAANPFIIIQLLDRIQSAEDALRVASVELASLIPNPGAPNINDWPMKNEADRECANKAFINVREHFKMWGGV